MKCPECGQWNRASMPHCSRCGAPLNIGASGRTPWKDTLKDGAKPNSYLRADEFGQVDTRPDSRDALAREMQDLKKRKEEGLRLQQRLRRESGRNPSPLIVDEVTPESDPAAARNSGAVLRMRRTSPDSLAEEREREARHRVRYMDDTGVYLESRTYDPPAPPLGAASAVYPAGHASTLALPLRMRRRRRFLHGGRQLMEAFFRYCLDDFPIRQGAALLVEPILRQAGGGVEILDGGFEVVIIPAQPQDVQLPAFP